MSRGPQGLADPPARHQWHAAGQYPPPPALTTTAGPTSSPQTRVIWAAHTYNVAFSDEIGHFEFCNGPNPIPASPFGIDAQGNPIACPAGNVEGRGTDTEPTDGDDNFCFPGSEALLVHVNGCTDTNTGFDGVSYQRVWPDGNTAVHPQPWLFSSPLTGPQLQRQLHPHGVRGRPAKNRGGGPRRAMRPHDRGRMHADPGHRRRSAGRLLPVLQHAPRERPRPRVPVGVRQRLARGGTTLAATRSTARCSAAAT